MNSKKFESESDSTRTKNKNLVLVRQFSEEPDLPLSEYSPRDKSWNTNKANTQKLSKFLTAYQEFLGWAARMNGCSLTLGFAEIIDKITGEINTKLQYNFFCHCRHCPICDARRSIVRTKRFREALPELEKKYPNSRWIFLTLTVPNPPVSELRATLKKMNQAWSRFRKRKEFKPVLGFIRATEVTQEKNRTDYAHPHFHVLLLEIGRAHV